MGVLYKLPIYVEPQPVAAPSLVVAEPEDDSYPEWAERPRTRADCLKGGPDEERPCPWITCRWHLYVDVSHRGRLDVEVTEMKHTCVLDVADDGGLTLEEIGDLMGVTRERIRQLEAQILGKLKKRGNLRTFLGE